MRSGRLDHRITIERPTVSRNVATGARTVTWSTLATLWAEKRESATGNEDLMARVNVAARPTKFITRWRADITTAMRVREGSRLWQVVGTAEGGRRVSLEIQCVEYSHESPAA